MTSPTSAPTDELPNGDLAARPADTGEAKATIEPFKFPFKPGELAAAKGTGQLPWYRNGVKDGHAKTPGAAPPGTRRSMGKR